MTVRRCGISSVVVVAAVVVAARGVGAAEVRYFRTDSKAAFAQGTADSVSVGEYGELTLGGAIEELAALDPPYVYQAHARGDGWVVGTGSSGLVLSVAADGSVTSLPPLAEEHVFAVTVDAEGDIWAGSSPSGQLYRWDGESWTSYAVHQNEELYIWALQPFDGGVYVATGGRGRVLKVSKDGVVDDLAGELDSHVRSLHLLEDGSLLAGTEGTGKIIHISGNEARVLHVAAIPEIVAVTGNGEGTCYAAAVKSPASWVAGAAQQAAAAAVSANGASTATVTVSAGTQSGDGAATTTVLRFACDGGTVETLDEWEGETAYDLAVHQGSLWVATGQEGKIYRFDDGGTRLLEHDLDESQVVSLVATGDRLAIAATNGGKLAVAGPGKAAEGTFQSSVFDAGMLSRVGALSWVGEGGVSFAVRSGQTGTPDDGWGAWSEWREGRSIDFAAVPEGRFLQWRARLTGGAKLSQVELAYRQNNVAPRITKLEVLPAGEVLVDSSFNPGQQVFEPTRPARDGIFTTLNPSSGKDGEQTKTLWKAGARSLRWKAEDRNEDELRYRVEVRPEDGDWMPVVEDLVADFVTLDATVLPDGAYRFRVIADDAESNEETEVLTHSAVSPLVFLDQSPPVLGMVSRDGSRVEVEIEDRASALLSIEVSRDGEEWQAATVADGSVDEKSETVVLEIGGDNAFVILRATDRAYNHAVFLLPQP